MDTVLADLRYRELQQRLEPFAGHPILERPVATWVWPHDKHLPRQVLGYALSRLLRTDEWEEIGDLPGVGAGRRWKLLNLIERAARELVDPTPAGPPPADPVVPTAPLIDPDAIPLDHWQRWAMLIRRHRLDRLPLGRFTRSLEDLSAGLWTVPLGDFLTGTTDAVSEYPSVGPGKARQVRAVVADVGQAVEAADAGHLLCRLLTDRLHAVAGWIDAVLASDDVPDVAAVRVGLIDPLLDQMATDLGEDVAGLVRRRWGTDGPTATLQELAEERGLTRERVRQIAARVEGVLAVRWPEGRHLLDDLFERLQEAPGAEPQLALVGTVLDAGYSHRLARSASRDDVTAAWAKAGRQKLTPMPADDLRRWAGAEFPHLPPAAIERWLRADGPVGRADDGTEVVFSREPLDLVLHALYADPTPVSLADLAAHLNTEERSLSNRLDRDPRFVEDDGQVMASERAGFIRRGGEWRVLLGPTGEFPVTHLLPLVLAGLTQQGIVDATVWGVRRYADEVLTATCGLRLSKAVGPFPLAAMLVRLSDDRVRPMRRRRLRWDRPGGPPARGKRGWVGELVARANTPLTSDEVEAGLRVNYQDYEDYVYNQMSFADEDGASVDSFFTTPGNSTRVPKLFVPHGWRLAADGANVSAGVRRFAARVCGARGNQRLARSELAATPWMVTLCDHLSYGMVQWADYVPANERPADSPPTQGLPATENGDSPPPLSDLLDRLLS